MSREKLEYRTHTKIECAEIILDCMTKYAEAPFFERRRLLKKARRYAKIFNILNKAFPEN